MQRVVIVGGGISGLATAHALLTTHAHAGLTVHVLEGSSRLGGNIRTSRRDGFLIDDGPDSWVTQKPQATALAISLGLGDRLIETRPDRRKVYVMSDARGGPTLVPLPAGLTLGIPTRLLPTLTTPLLSWRGKLRAAFDLLEPNGFRRRGAGDDESVADFIERRLGREVLDRLAGPLLGGLFTGDVAQLSLQATFPQLAALEKNGGLIRGARRMAPRRAHGEPPPSAFTSLVGGVGELVDALAAHLGDVVTRDRPVTRIARLPPSDARGTFVVEVSGGEPLHAHHVVVTGTAHVAAGLVREIDAQVADVLAEIPHASSATVFLALRAADVPRALDATGYLVPSPLGRAALASTWVSSKWEGRAPKGTVLLRVFFGARHVDLDDANLVALARDEIRASLGVVAAPTLTHVARFRAASPQPRVGHPTRIHAITERLRGIGSIHLVGSAYDGVGIADCIRQSQKVAHAIADAARTVH